MVSRWRPLTHQRYQSSISYTFGGVPKWGESWGIPIAGGFSMEHPIYKWMIRGYPGYPHFMPHELKHRRHPTGFEALDLLFVFGQFGHVEPCHWWDGFMGPAPNSELFIRWSIFWGFHSHGGTPIAGWFLLGKIIDDLRGPGYPYFRNPPFGMINSFLIFLHGENQGLEDPIFLFSVDFPLMKNRWFPGFNRSELGATYMRNHHLSSREYWEWFCQLTHIVCLKLVPDWQHLGNSVWHLYAFDWTSKIKKTVMNPSKSVQITAFGVNLCLWATASVPTLLDIRWNSDRTTAQASARFLSFHHSNFTQLLLQLLVFGFQFTLQLSLRLWDQQ